MAGNGFVEKVVFAGFGGQGVMLLGKVLAQAAMEAGYEVTYMPSYGAEVRGGTAKSTVVVSDRPIACPVVSDPDVVVAMNDLSSEKFSPQLKSGGLLILNSSLVRRVPERDDIDVVNLPADEIAGEIGSVKIANMVALGAYLAKRGYLDPGRAVRALSAVLSARHHQTIPANEKAIEQGVEFVKHLEG